MTFADTINAVSKVATESVDTASESADGVAGKITLAVAALVLPVLWGLAVHLVFNWLSRRHDPTPSEDPLKQDS